MKFILLILICCYSHNGMAQKNKISTKDSLKQFTYRLINKALTKKRFKKLAIWDFTDQLKEETNIGAYLGDQISIYSSDIDSVIVLDRQNLKSIIKEHKLKDKDLLIDQEALLQLGKFSGAEVLVVGKVGVFETECSMQIYLKIVDANTAETFSAAEEYIPIDKKFADVSGLSLNCLGMDGNASGKPGRDFNRPAASNEQYNNEQKLIEAGCEEKNVGTLCFYNNTSDEVIIDIYKTPQENLNNAWQWGEKETLKLKPLEAKCVYNYLAGYSYKFAVQIQKMNHGFIQNEVYDEGSIQIEKCKSKTYTIKKVIVNEVKKNVNQATKETSDKLLKKGWKLLLERIDKATN
jgi:hypothetical protein